MTYLFDTVPTAQALITGAGTEEMVEGGITTDMCRPGTTTTTEVVVVEDGDGIVM